MINIMSSVRILVPALMAVALGGAAMAQDLPARDLPENGGAGIRTGHITATGRTVPIPGASESAGTTPMDKGIEREDTKIESGICKGC